MLIRHLKSPSNHEIVILVHKDHNQLNTRLAKFLLCGVLIQIFCDSTFDTKEAFSGHCEALLTALMYNVNIWRRVTIPHCEWTRDCSCNWHIKCLILMWSCEAARHSLKSFTFPGARRRVAATQFHNICDCPGHHIILPFRTPVTCPSHCYWADIYSTASPVDDSQWCQDDSWTWDSSRGFQKIVFFKFDIDAHQYLDMMVHSAFCKSA